jgi:hypothetical protein
MDRSRWVHDAPIDMHRMPDGRLLVVSRRELALGDGVRWETYQTAAESMALETEQVAVDGEGAIYAAVRGGFARVEFGPDGYWRLRRVAWLPTDPVLENAVLRNVASVGGEWFWYGAAGAVVSWRPGAKAEIVARTGVDERPFGLGGEAYYFDQTTGRLQRVARPGGATVSLPLEPRAERLVTCTVPAGSGRLLVGTVGDGLKLFDGTKFEPFSTSGLLVGGHRVADLCAVGDEYYAVALASVGIVFVDRRGRLVQVLGRSYDSRLARVQRLLEAEGGVVWALLEDGMARVEFPAPISHFGALLEDGVNYARPVRHEGRLWMLSDSRVLRGVYGVGGELERFEVDSPRASFSSTLGFRKANCWRRTRVASIGANQTAGGRLRPASFTRDLESGRPRHRACRTWRATRWGGCDGRATDWWLIALFVPGWAMCTGLW